MTATDIIAKPDSAKTEQSGVLEAMCADSVERGPSPCLQSENLILGAVPAEEFEAFKDYLEPYPLRTRETLQEAGEEPDWVYFPTSGIISVLTVLESGMMIEFATIGREGTSAVPLVVGLERSNLALVSLLPGSSMRMRTHDFMKSLAQSPGLASAIRSYRSLMFALLAQSAACNRAHHVDERCARWLLMTHDRAEGDKFPITHEFLAQMLGVSRPSVSSSAATLQNAGLISYHRGEMNILDRKGLESAACECYEITARQFDRFFAQLPADTLATRRCQNSGPRNDAKFRFDLDSGVAPSPASDRSVRHVAVRPERRDPFA